MSTTRFGRTAPGSDSPSDHVGVVAEIGASTASDGATRPD